MQNGRPSRPGCGRPGSTGRSPALASLVLALFLLLGGVSGARDVASGASDPETVTPGRSAATDAEIQRLRDLHFQEQEQVRLVLLPTVVTNRRGRPIQGLDAEDFRILEDYVPQEIRHFGTERNQPVSIAFLLDVSGSMRVAAKLEEAKEAIRVFVDDLAGDDQFGLVCFADDQVAWITEFTRERERFLLRLQVQEPYGQTALLDALAAAPRLVDSRIHGRKAVVLFTDGADNASELSLFEAIRLARSVNVPIYTVALSSLADKIRPKGSLSPSQRVLKEFSEETGGLLLTVYDPDDLKEAVLAIQQELRFQYVIGYRPTRTHWDGTFRRIKLEAVRDGLVVRTRSGYYADP